MENEEFNIIKNKENLFATHKFKSVFDCFSALEYAFENSDPSKLVENSIHIKADLLITDLNNNAKSYSLPRKDSIFVISVGKASEKMLSSFLKKMGDKVYKSILVVPKNHKLQKDTLNLFNKTITIYSSHPIPDGNSVRAANIIIDNLKNIDKSKMVVFLISGGSSSLLVKPIKGITLQTKKVINKLLISSGADIREINIVRKHLSDIKGGKILEYLDSEVCVISLILSDVVGDYLDTIGSGLTSIDESTYSDAKNILKKYSLLDTKLISTKKIGEIIELGIKSQLPETMKRTNAEQRNFNNYIIGNNAYFCKYILQYMKNKGYQVMYLGSKCNTTIENFTIFSKQLVEKNLESKSCILLGGELVNVLPKDKPIGKGGRNQEAICNLISYFKTFNSKDYAVICLGTDGIDGNSTAAGGLLTPRTMEILKQKHLNENSYIRRHDSNTLLSQLNSTIITNYTGTNFNDVYLFLRND